MTAHPQFATVLGQDPASVPAPPDAQQQRLDLGGDTPVTVQLTITGDQERVDALLVALWQHVQGAMVQRAGDQYVARAAGPCDGCGGGNAQ